MPSHDFAGFVTGTTPTLAGPARRIHRAWRRTTERGFTLIEVVLALSILALMITMLFAGLRVGLRAWQRGEQRAEVSQHSRSLTELLKHGLAGAYTYQGKLDQNSSFQIVFQGKADRLSFATISPPVPFPVPIAFTAVTLSVDAGAAPGLAVREKALPNFDPFEEVTPTLVDPSVIAISFRYLRDGGSWEEAWDAADERALPQAIEVTLTAMINGRVEVQPPMTIPIRVTTP